MRSLLLFGWTLSRRLRAAETAAFFSRRIRIGIGSSHPTAAAAPEIISSRSNAFPIVAHLAAVSDSTILAHSRIGQTIGETA